jgi:hypothetical protein
MACQWNAVFSSAKCPLNYLYVKTKVRVQSRKKCDHFTVAGIILLCLFSGTTTEAKSPAKGVLPSLGQVGFFYAFSLNDNIPLDLIALPRYLSTSRLPTGQTCAEPVILRGRY